MEYRNDELGVCFSVPEKITVRAQLRYRSLLAPISNDRATFYEAFWNAAEVVIEGWKCDAVKPGDDLDGITDQRAADVIKWVGMRVSSHMDKLGEVPKN